MESKYRVTLKTYGEKSIEFDFVSYEEAMIFTRTAIERGNYCKAIIEYKGE